MVSKSANFSLFLSLLLFELSTLKIKNILDLIFSQEILVLNDLSGSSALSLVPKSPEAQTFNQIDQNRMVSLSVLLPLKVVILSRKYSFLDFIFDFDF